MCWSPPPAAIAPDAVRASAVTALVIMCFNMIYYPFTYSVLP
jgi:hypothetical protein